MNDRNLYAAAFLYTAVGGYLDAYCYLTHGHVFANAQTGNIVLLGLALAEGSPAEALHHLPPILTFIAGVLVVLLLVRDSRFTQSRLRTLSASVELAVLVLLFLPGPRVPDAYVVPSIAFVAAVQVTGFGAVRGWKFNSAMTTGNLRATLHALVLWRTGNDPEENRKTFLATGAICLCFATGALLGGVVSRAFPREALLPCILGVAAAAYLAGRHGP